MSTSQIEAGKLDVAEPRVPETRIQLTVEDLERAMRNLDERIADVKRKHEAFIAGQLEKRDDLIEDHRDVVTLHDKTKQAIQYFEDHQANDLLTPDEIAELNIFHQLNVQLQHERDTFLVLYVELMEEGDPDVYDAVKNEASRENETRDSKGEK